MAISLSLLIAVILSVAEVILPIPAMTICHFARDQKKERTRKRFEF